MEGNKVDWRRTEVGRSAGLLRAFNAVAHLHCEAAQWHGLCNVLHAMWSRLTRVETAT
jgi:hypothetical protein